MLTAPGSLSLGSLPVGAKRADAVTCRRNPGNFNARPEIRLATKPPPASHPPTIAHATAMITQISLTEDDNVVI
jgi:hypothetical protein